VAVVGPFLGTLRLGRAFRQTVGNTMPFESRAQRRAACNVVLYAKKKSIVSFDPVRRHQMFCNLRWEKRPSGRSGDDRHRSCRDAKTDL